MNRWLSKKYKSVRNDIALNERKHRKFNKSIIKFFGKIIPKKVLFVVFKNKAHYIGGSDVLPPPLSAEEERALVLEIEKDESRTVLIEHNLRLVVYIAKKFENTGINLEDLISIGTIGLIKAINTFKADKNIKLATYASRCIENEILMYLRKTSSQKFEISIDEPLNTDYDGNELVLSDILGSDSDQIQKIIDDEVDKELLHKAIAGLGNREREIMLMRFGLLGYEELTQKEVALKLGISQSYISRLEKKIILRLKKDMNKMLK